MRILFWFLLLAAAAVAVALAAKLVSGYVLFVAPPYRVELSLNLFLVLAVAGFVAGYALMAAIGHYWRAGPLYYTGLGVASLCALWHFWLIRTRERDRCFRAFLHNHWLGLAVFAGIAADFVVRAGAWPQSL